MSGSVFSRRKDARRPRGFRPPVKLRCGAPLLPANVTARALETTVAELGGFAHG